MQRETNEYVKCAKFKNFLTSFCFIYLSMCVCVCVIFAFFYHFFQCYRGADLAELYRFAYYADS